MNQVELYKWFCNQRLSGNESFFGVKEVEQQTGEIYLALKIRTLYAYGYLESEDALRWKVKYRIKKFYADKENLVLKSPLDKNISVAEYRELSR